MLAVDNLRWIDPDIANVVILHLHAARVRQSVTRVDTLQSSRLEVQYLQKLSPSRFACSLVYRPAWFYAPAVFDMPGRVIFHIYLVFEKRLAACYRDIRLIVPELN